MKTIALYSATIALLLLTAACAVTEQLYRHRFETKKKILDNDLAVLRSKVTSRAALVPQLRTNYQVLVAQAELAELKSAHDKLLLGPLGWPSLLAGGVPVDPTLLVTK